MATINSWNSNNPGVAINVNTTGSQSTSIGTGGNSGTINIGNTSSGAVAIDCGTAGITVGTTANAHTSTFGSTNSTSATTIQSGSGALALTSTNGTWTGNSGNGALGLSIDALSTTVSIATGSGVKTLTVGSTNSTSTTTLQSGSGALNISSVNGAITMNSGSGNLGISTDASATTVSLATGAAAKAVTLGSTNTTSALTLNSGSGGIKAIGVASVAVANKNYVTINTSTGALGSDAGPSSSITITGDSGGGLTGTSFTFTGGSTGLTFAGAGTTETLGGTLAIANGGTNATSMSTSTGIVKYDGTRLVTSSTALIDSSNRMTNTSQPAFLVQNTTSPASVTGDGTLYTMVYDTTVFDQNSNFSGTNTFTAPVTGRYAFVFCLAVTNIFAANTNWHLKIVTTANTFDFSINPASIIIPNGAQFQIACFANMTASDTATTKTSVSGGAKTVGIQGSAAGSPVTFWSGYLVC